MKLNFAKNYIDYFKKNEGKAKHFWQIAKPHKASQPSSGSRSLSSRNNNKIRAINANACPGIIDTSSVCTHCKECHSLWDIREKMINNKELSISCKKCAKCFIPHFAIHPFRYNNKYRRDLQQEYLNPSVLLAVLDEIQKSPTASLDNSYLYEHCPVIFWNLLIFFSDIYLELNHYSGSEVQAYTVYDYINKEEDDLQDSGSSSEGKEQHTVSKMKPEKKLKKQQNFNATHFLTIHTDGNNSTKHRGSGTFGKSRCNANQKIVTINVSRKELKKTSIGLYTINDTISKKYNNDDRPRTTNRTILIPKEGFMFSKVEKTIADFSTTKKHCDERTGLSNCLMGLNSLKNEQKTKCKGTILIEKIIQKHKNKINKEKESKIVNLDIELYGNCLKNQLEKNDEKEIKYEKKQSIAQHLLTKAMRLLLMKVSIASDKNLIEVQNFAVCNNLLRVEE